MLGFHRQRTWRLGIRCIVALKRQLKMLFKIGISVVVVTAVVMFYLNNYLKNNQLDKVRELTEDDQMSTVTKDDLVDAGKGEDLAQAQNSEEDVNEDFDDYTLKDDKLQDDKEKATSDDGQTLADRAKKPVPSGLQPVILKTGSQLKDVDKTKTPPIHLSVVACGDRGEESVILLKSAILFSKSPLVFHIFTEKELQKYFRDQIEMWPDEFKNRLEYRIYDITLPPGETGREDEWLKLFKPCASQRLFLPTLLLDVDSLIYTDTDVLFVSPLEEFWQILSKFNSTQLVALAPEHEDAAIGWYNRFARHPYYGKLGLNSGVMLMNMTRLRQTKWLPEIMAHYKEYRLKITWGDQDLINIYFHYHPDQMYQIPCEWNYRPDHCMYMSVCKGAEGSGARILHGSRRVMHNDKQPAFKAVYTALRNYQFGENLEYHLLEKMKRSFTSLDKSRTCEQRPELFTAQIEKNLMHKQ